ncbi:MAG: translation elongation factor Ts [Puniceicoccales bacterium]|jgi:elongation factor Ts|nr:translation elongation factor Ts [Puniceicoccales bacterium]
MVVISAKMVGELRERTGAGLMDCKQALSEGGGDFEKAIEILRRKGVASAAKKADRTAVEGIIEAYIHTGGRVGVLLQLNCETDFVAKNEQFKILARDVAMHIAATAPIYIQSQDVPLDVVAREEAFAAEQVVGKPAHAIEAIVKGKMEKYYASVCLLNQPFVKDPNVTVGELIGGFVARIGENIRIGRFSRFQIGT